MKIFSYVLGLLCLLPLASCSSGDGTLNGEDLGLFNNKGNRLSDNTLYFGYEGGTQSVYVYNAHVKKMSVNTNDTSFITVKTYYNNEFSIKISPNYSDKERTAEIMFDMGISHEVLHVSQARCTIAAETNNASDITVSSAVLNGTLSGINERVEVGFYYGTQSNSLTKKISLYNSAGTFTAKVSGLSKSTKYFFRAYVVVNGKQFDGFVQQFTTATPGMSGDSSFDKEEFNSDKKI